MIQHNVEQGSDDWFKARLGIPTASEFDRIITPTGKPSTQAGAYANRLIAEILTGKPVETFEKTPWMERGNQLEEHAAQFYAMQCDIDPLPAGFCTTDDRTAGASPDRFIGEDGLLEIKCPAPHTHVDYLIRNQIDTGYIPQVQGQLYVTGRAWVDWLSYHPEMPPVIIRVTRDQRFIQELAAQLAAFHATLNARRETLRERGHL